MMRGTSCIKLFSGNSSIVPGSGVAEKGSATVLGRKDKVRVFQELVSEDDELSHEGGKGEFFGFATGEETKVEHSEHRMVAEGDACRRGKGGRGPRAAAEGAGVPAGRSHGPGKRWPARRARRPWEPRGNPV